MIWISHIVGEILDDIEEKPNKVIIHEYYFCQSHIIQLPHRPRHTQILGLHPLNPRHLI